MHDFGDLQLLEHTRGIWTKKQPETVKYAYATYRSIIKEVYEIYTWVPLALNNTSLVNLIPKKLQNGTNLLEKAPQEIRNKYIGKLINKKRSYGDPFVKVGFDSSD